MRLLTHSRDSEPMYGTQASYWVMGDNTKWRHASLRHTVTDFTMVQR